MILLLFIFLLVLVLLLVLIFFIFLVFFVLVALVFLILFVLLLFLLLQGVLLFIETNVFQNTKQSVSRAKLTYAETNFRTGQAGLFSSTFSKLMYIVSRNFSYSTVFSSAVIVLITVGCYSSSILNLITMIKHFISI